MPRAAAAAGLPRPVNAIKKSYACPHGKQHKSKCVLCGGKKEVLIPCMHGKQRSRCVLCGGTPQLKKLCVHGKQPNYCVKCGNSKYVNVCVHDKNKWQCVQCRTLYKCRHKRQKSKCRLCGGKKEKRRLCVHKKQRTYCLKCGNKRYMNKKIFCVHHMRRKLCRHCNFQGFNNNLVSIFVRQCLRSGGMGIPAAFRNLMGVRF